jgi:drug/metabolite transporter (DMT)-like permease
LTTKTFNRRIALAGLLLFMAPMFWAGNIVIARAYRAELPPFGTTFWRWTLAAIVFLPFVWPLLRNQWPVIWREARFIAILSLLGLSGFASLMYSGLQTTTALNASFIMAMSPVIIPLVVWLGSREGISILHAIGIIVSAIGAIVIISAGNPLRLLQGNFNDGDLLVIGAMIVWSVYSVIVRYRPKDLHPNVLLWTTMVFGSLATLPLSLWEATTRPMPLSTNALMAISYIVLFPSIGAYFCFNRGIEIVCPNKGGLAMHLVPLFSAVLAVLFLGEAFQTYHGAGILAIFLGIGLVTRAGNRS